MLLLNKWVETSSRILLAEYLEKPDYPLPLPVRLAIAGDEVWNGELIESTKYAYINLRNSNGVLRQVECDSQDKTKIEEYIHCVNEHILKDINQSVQEWLTDSVELEGTPKQIVWATTIRKEAFQRIILDRMRPWEGKYSDGFFDHLAGQKRLDTVVKNLIQEIDFSVAKSRWDTEEGRSYCKELCQQYAEKYRMLDSTEFDKFCKEHSSEEASLKRGQERKQLAEDIAGQLRQIPYAKVWIEARFEELGAPILFSLVRVVSPDVEIPKEVRKKWNWQWLDA